MQEVLAAIAAGKAELDRHPLFTWMEDPSVAPEDRFVFAPLFANFILGFRDLNRWFLRYPEPQSAYEHAINHHTEEDETHSALFLEDWAELRLDDRLGWGVEDTVAWFYADPHTEVFRRYGSRLVQMCVDTPDPLVRFGFMEAIEACGHVFFGRTAPLAAEMSAASGARLRYFGPYHLARETGALIDADDLFDSVRLTEEQRRRSIALVEEVFAMFADKQDHLLAFGRRLAAGDVPRSPAARLAGGAPPPIRGGAPLSHHAVQREVPPTETHRPLVEQLRRRMADLDAHPLLTWMTHGAGDAGARLRTLLPLWIPDVMGYPDLMTYGVRYPGPATPEERAINRQVELLASHHRLFVRDLAQLRLDAAVPWAAGATLDFLGRGDATELQRRSAAAFLDAAYRHRSPVVRYWLVEALQASGEAFFRELSRLAGEVEAHEGIRLDYLADRHRVAHPTLPPDAEADAVEFPRLAAHSDEVAACRAVIDLVFDQLELQFDQSLAAVTEVPIPVGR